MSNNEVSKTVAKAPLALELFTMTTPETGAGLGLNPKKDDLGNVRSVTLVLETRKAVALRLGLEMNKENAPKIDAEILRMKDAVKTIGAAEMVKLASSPNWTGATFRMSQNKDGSKKRATFSLTSVDRTGARVSEDVLVKAMASLTEDQQVAIMEKAEELKKQQNPTEV